MVQRPWRRPQPARLLPASPSWRFGFSGTGWGTESPIVHLRQTKLNYTPIIIIITIISSYTQEDHRKCDSLGQHYIMFLYSLFWPPVWRSRAWLLPRLPAPALHLRAQSRSLSQAHCRLSSPSDPRSLLPSIFPSLSEMEQESRKRKDKKWIFSSTKSCVRCHMTCSSYVKK